MYQEKLSPESLQRKEQVKENSGPKLPSTSSDCKFICDINCMWYAWFSLLYFTLTENCLSYTRAFGLGQKIPFCTRSDYKLICDIYVTQYTRAFSLGQKIPYCTSSDYKFICYILLYVKSSFGCNA